MLDREIPNAIQGAPKHGTWASSLKPSAVHARDVSWGSDTIPKREEPAIAKQDIYIRRAALRILECGRSNKGKIWMAKTNANLLLIQQGLRKGD